VTPLEQPVATEELSSSGVRRNPYEGVHVVTSIDSITEGGSVVARTQSLWRLE
jgi:hypothetical protein